MKKGWIKILSWLGRAAIHPIVVAPLALFGAVNLVLWGGIIWSTWPSPHRDCVEMGGGWDSEKNICPIISECLDKGGCYALPTEALPKDQPFCLFGKDMTPEACYDSQWLREHLNP